MQLRGVHDLAALHASLLLVRPSLVGLVLRAVLAGSGLLDVD